MKELPPQLPITVSLGSQGGQPFAWIDCLVRDARNQVISLSPLATLSARLRTRLRHGESGYVVFEDDGAAFAWKGVVRLAERGRALEFLILEHSDAIVGGPPAPADGEPLLRVMYISQAAPDLDEDDFDSILAAASRRNPSASVTGALCLHEGFFGQILEGPEDAVRSIYESIERDPRHRDPLILLEERASYRLYGGWAMKGIHGENELTAADELSARLALAQRDDTAEISSRWLRLLQTDSAPSWRDEWLAGRQSVLMLRQLVEQTGPPADAA